MILNKKTKLIFNSNQARFVLMLLLLCTLPAVLGSETYRITTYYPAPVASYHQLRAIDRVRAGTNAAVEIGNNIFAGIIQGTVKTPEISTFDIEGDIIFAPGNERVTFGGTVINFCKWVPYGRRVTQGVNVNKSNAFCPVGWAAVAISATNDDDGSRMRYISSINTEIGYMLCCRFDTVH
jgi:hypothetical protein